MTTFKDFFSSIDDYSANFSLFLYCGESEHTLIASLSSLDCSASFKSFSARIMTLLWTIIPERK